MRDYYRIFRPQTWLFPSRDPRQHLSIDALQRAFAAAKQAAGLRRGHGPHTLRHSYATHLLDAGVDILTIQKLLGHAQLSSTLRYAKVTRRKIETTPSPYDLLFQAASQTLLKFGKDRLKGKLGVISLLHTWTQLLKMHVHLHCLVPQGALSFNGERWHRPVSDRWLFDVRELSEEFRKRFVRRLKSAFRAGKLPGTPVGHARAWSFPGDRQAGEEDAGGMDARLHR